MYAIRSYYALDFDLIRAEQASHATRDRERETARRVRSHPKLVESYNFV